MALGRRRPPESSDGSSAAGDPALPLELRGVGMRFGGTVALTDVTFSVAPAEQVGLIGPNGAGKTTLLGTVSGLLRPTSGRVLRHGQDVTHQAAVRRARAGIGRTFQHSSRFTALTAAESIAVAVLAHRTDHPFARGVVGRGRPLASAMRDARGLMDELGVGAHADLPAGELPLGIARLVDVARAICGDPDLLLLDEPSSGLDERERDHLKVFLRRHVGERGTAFILVEHDVEFVRDLCERIVVLDFGRKIADAPSSQALSDAAVRAAYLGEENPDEQPERTGIRVVEAPAAAVAAEGTAPSPEFAVELHNISAGYGKSLAISKVTISLRRGGATAVLGPNGSGKTTLARVVTGQLRPLSGSLRIDGRDVTGTSSPTLARQGLYHVPDARAIYPSLTVRENLRMAFRYRVPKREMDDHIQQVVELFPALRRHVSTRAGSLSGGEQQMLAIAPAIAVPPNVLVVDELSHGLSPIVVGQMFEILARLKGQVTMIVVEQFTGRALELADDVVALRRGLVVFDGTASSVTDEDVASWYTLDSTEESPRLGVG
jgi:ABC-type branched-subunit amino acid transport system ATPase component